MKITFLAILLAVPGISLADARFYSEFKNDVIFEDFDYVEDSDRNNLRFGTQWNNFYVEAGAVEYSSEFGTSYEAGYKFQPVERVEIKGKLEGYKFKDEKATSKLETEIRYYFN